MKLRAGVVTLASLVAGGACRGEHAERGGPATAMELAAAADTLTQAPSSQPPLDTFDLTAAPVARNSMLIEPQWKWQMKHAGYTPDPSLCSGFTQRDNTVSLGDPPCTTQPVSFDEGRGFNGFICGLGGESGKLHGHVNWQPATYEGRLLAWDSHAEDGDYTLMLQVPKERGLLAGNNHYLHVEFDASETIDRFNGPWWQQFHDAVAHDDELWKQFPPRTDSEAPGMLPGNTAIVSGLFGVDTQHGFSSEVHPVWALAIHVQNDSANETWAFFVRNWGDDGFCSDRQWIVDLKAGYTFVLPWRPGATRVTINADSTVFFSFPAGTPGPEIAFKPESGVFLSFTLPDPKEEPIVEGEVHLHWTLAPAQGRRGATAAVAKPVRLQGPSTPTDRTEDELKRLLLQVPPDQRDSVRASLRSGPRVSTQRVQGTPAFRPFVARPGGNIVAQVRSVRDSAAPGRRGRAALALCRAFKDSIPGLPRNACAASRNR